MAMTELLLFFLFTSTVLVHAQQGFISIDCGIPEGSNYTDDETGIFYTSDAGFIRSGENREFPASNPVASSLKLQYRTMRSFQEGGRNCYTLQPVQKGSRYFLRASFVYVDYEKQEAPEFDLYVGINLWTTVSLTNASLPWWTEILVLSPRDFIPVCLVNTNKGAPFISALEARLVKNSMYTPASYNQSLRAMWLYDAGSSSGKIIRYPDDNYDRLWLPYTDPSWESISTSLTVDNIYLGFDPPSAVMQTAATPLNGNDSLYFNWTANYPGKEFHVMRHFADFEKSNGSATLREIDCCMNGHSCLPLTTEYLVAATVYTTLPMTGEGDYSVSFTKTKKSVLPPILNAIEIYFVLSLNETATDEQDVGAIMKVKGIYRLQKNWMGDPCLPNTYLWDGLTCSYNSDDRSPRIISLNLSSSGLTGNIHASFGNLNMIQTLVLSKNNLTGPIPSFLAKLTSLNHLDLSANKLTGEIPEFLATLSFLTFLNLSGNNFTGPVPSALLQRSKSGTLQLSVDNQLSVNDSDACATSSCKKKKKNAAVPVSVSLSAVALLLLVAGFIFWRKFGRKRAGASSGSDPYVKASDGNGSLNLDNRRFTYAELKSMTSDFQTVLGKGGFGTVYYGRIDDGTQVAVKLLSHNRQGSSEFHIEAQLLTRVYHRNLVQLIGYCAEGDKTALILEYMAQGNLSKFLLDKNRAALSWGQRLRIAMDVAQGLEYLHTGCKPPIIHRDVKGTNILLNERLEAKIADFGLSKVLSNEEFSHVSTVVKGTLGYLDPEYIVSNNLNEKSDVYSFGIVMLELITGRPAIVLTSDSSQRISIVDWVNPLVSRGDVRAAIDPRLGGDYDINSAWKSVEIAIACAAPKAIQRPTMSIAVSELKECLGAERVPQRSNSQILSEEIEPINTSDSLFFPKAR